MEQVAPQSIPAGDDVTEPFPVPLRTTFNKVLAPAATAWWILMRGWEKPRELPPWRTLTGVPVICRAVTISSTVAAGMAFRMSANAPATWGAAMDVPEYDAELSVGIAELM